jgi:hypothetical protein
MPSRLSKRDGADSIIMSAITYRARDGAMFHSSFITRDLTAASQHELLFETGAVQPFANIKVEAEAACEITAVEGVTTTANGASVAVINVNRMSSATSLSKLYSSPTWSNGSSVVTLGSIYVGGGTTKEGSGGNAKQDIEWPLRTNTKYLLTIKNVSVATITANFIIDFSES